MVKQEEKRATLAAAGGIEGQARGMKDEGSRNGGVKEGDSAKNVRKESQKALKEQWLGSEFKGVTWSVRWPVSKPNAQSHLTQGRGMLNSIKCLMYFETSLKLGCAAIQNQILSHAIRCDQIINTVGLSLTTTYSTDLVHVL